ncbi:glucose-fructose oxidoreductase [Salinigranum rubrum]|uniref:Glucose-fructose oxidoreductase n=1 Tax=Salinigranum rubrum TaxID=755307 RepID=A0A2I8VL06_9EURY|nr:Gfo/Idh/MocA family oxidoreductase [Salinigranum rubrum]AUV82598.1 glucose-fructose oxidoreductase [Salinigranum rubrum]
MTYDVALVGTGADPDDPSTDGFAMAYRHARAYSRLESCRVAACADIVIENARRFAAEYDIDEDGVFREYETMLEEAEPDIVSVCVPPAIHADIVIGCAESDVPQAIHCEKPMAGTWGECREMARVCDEHDIQLTFNHQRRFGHPFRKAKVLVDDGSIGRLERIEVGGKNLYDYGSHLFDLCGYFTEQEPVEYVLGQIDYSEENVQFGMHNENQSIVQWRYENGVGGMASTGAESLLRSQMRLVGDDGVIEIGHEDGPPLRFRSSSTTGWMAVDTEGDTVHGPTSSRASAAVRFVADRLPLVPADRLVPEPSTFVDRAIADVVASLAESRESELSASNALQATELIFAAWESARRRGRVDLPLDVETNPLEEMVTDGHLPVQPSSSASSS